MKKEERENSYRLFCGARAYLGHLIVIPLAHRSLCL